MIRKINRRLPSPGLVVAIAALVAALAGTAVALPGKNSVDGNDLRRAVVKTKNIKNGAVTTAKIRAGAVRTARIGDNAVNSAKLAPGSVTASDLGTITVRQASSPLTADADGTQNGPAGPVATATATANCEAGEVLLSGGASWFAGNNDNDENLYINESYPNGQGWTAEGIVDFGAQGQARLRVHAVCLG
jgi:hypothetical protein